MKAVAGRKRTCTVLSRNSFAYSYKIVVSAFIEIINMPEKFQKNRWSRSRSKFSFEIVLEPQK